MPSQLFIKSSLLFLTGLHRPYSLTFVSEKGVGSEIKSFSSTCVKQYFFLFVLNSQASGVDCSFLSKSTLILSLVGSNVAQLYLTLCGSHGLQPIRLLHPWDFPGKSAGVDCHFLLQGLQGIFLTQESNLGLPHCRQTLYRLSHQGSPFYL